MAQLSIRLDDDLMGYLLARQEQLRRETGLDVSLAQLIRSAIEQYRAEHPVYEAAKR